MRHGLSGLARDGLRLCNNTHPHKTHNSQPMFLYRAIAPLQGFIQNLILEGGEA